MIYFCDKFQKDPLFGVNLTFFAPWLPWQRLPFWIFSSLKSCHTLWWIFLQSFKESNFFFKSPFFVSMATAAKFVRPIPIFLAYLVPLDVDVVPIKIHQFLLWSFLCFSFFLAFWPFPWQRQPFWKKINHERHNFTWHMIFLQGFIKFDLGISEKCVRQTFDRRKKERKKEEE